ncbi:MAG TPA: CpsB/CapC family capsule biosynthesis tyrosine phosphatase [Tepidisphaeraceae bacterium]|jgi:protein-tyrosine phosphatase
MIGRIDVHSHLLPGVDDGCRDVAESLACARLMVGAGYTHSYCTPHVWPNLDNDRRNTPARVAALQVELEAAEIPLKLLPGGEMHLSATFCQTPAAELVTYNDARRYAIFDFWTDVMPKYFLPCVTKIKDAGIQPILAHPERIHAIQHDPDAIDQIAGAGVLLQCNLEPLGEEQFTRRRGLAEQWLLEDRYFLIGSDLHRLETLPRRLRGLERAIDLIGEDRVWTLTHLNPMQLAPFAPA